MLIEQARALSRTGMKKHLRVLPMYAGLPSPEQMKVFERVSRSVRKVRLLCRSQFLSPRRASALPRSYISGHIMRILQTLTEGDSLPLLTLPVSFQTVNQEYVLWLPFSSLISPRRVSSNFPVYFISLSILRSLRTTLSLSTSSCSCLHSEVLYFYQFLFLFVL